jgi:hypothetical protein
MQIDFISNIKISSINILSNKLYINYIDTVTRTAIIQNTTIKSVSDVANRIAYISDPKKTSIVL